jgi:hypothetical protein
MERGRKARWLSSTLVLVLSAAALLAPFVEAAASRPVAGNTATDSLPDSWAYGGSQLIDQSTTQGAVTVAQSGSYETAVLLTERSTGPFTLSLELKRGMVTQYQYSLCTPSCSAPSYGVQGSFSGREWSVEFLNLTTTATTTLGGASTPALGIVDLSLQEQSALSAGSSVTGESFSQVGTHVDSTSAAHVALAFSPPLGVIPFNPISGTSWSGSTAVRETGSWVRSSSASFSGVLAPNTRLIAQQNLSPTGTVADLGSTNGSASIAGGGSAQLLALKASNGFRLLDGLFLEPTGPSLFAAGGPLSARATGASENSTLVEYDPSASGHLGLVGTETGFQPSVSLPLGAPPEPTALAAATFLPPAFSVQSQPESAASAAASFGVWGFGSASSPILNVPARNAVADATIPLVLAGAGIAGILVALGVRWRGLDDGPGAVAATQAPTAGTPAGTTRGSPAPTRPAEPRDPFDDLL